MKTFIKILIGFVIGAVSTFMMMGAVFAVVENDDDGKYEESKEKIANYVRNLGYDVKKKEETNEFKFGFH